MSETTRVAMQRFERWKGWNFVAMILGTIVAFIVSSKLPPSTPMFTATLFLVVCLFILAAPLGSRSLAHNNNLPLRERVALGTILTLMVVLVGSLAGQMESLMQVLHHM